MARRDSFPLVDRLLGGRLVAYLSGLRAEGLSFEQVAFQLKADHDITVSSETIRRWLAEPPKPAKKATA